LGRGRPTTIPRCVT